MSVFNPNWGILGMVYGLGFALLGMFKAMQLLIMQGICPIRVALAEECSRNEVENSAGAQ